MSSTSKGEGRTLPKRFYKEARAERVSDGSGATAYRILLDGRPVRTPAKAELQLPAQALAEAVAEEWAAQAAHIDPSRMPLTRIANSTIDGVVARRAEVEAEIVRYAMNDLIYYRAEQPETLVRLQAQAWDPPLRWAEQSFATTLQTGQGIAHVEQPAALAEAVAQTLRGLPPLVLSALHVITTLTGSAVLALACARSRLAPDAVWAAAHVDEDFQISQWGWDAEAEARRKAREGDFMAAARILDLMRSVQHS